MMGVSKLTLAGVVALGALALGAPAAQAEIGLIGSFGQTGPGKLREPTSMASDPISGDLYIADTGHNRVVKYTAAGAFILTFGREVNRTKVQEAGTTAAEQDVCTASSGDECQEGVEGTGPGQFDTALGIAVDPGTGDVYVGNNGDNRVERFEFNGDYISQFASGVEGVPSFGLEFGSGENPLAVDLEGNVYVGTENQQGILKFSSAGSYVGRITSYEGPFGSLATDQLGSLYAYTAHTENIVKFNMAGGFLDLLRVPEGLTQLGGLTVDLATGDVFTLGERGRETGDDEISQYSPLGARITSFSAPDSGPGGGNSLAYDAEEGTLYELLRDQDEVAIYGTFATPTAKAPTIASESSSNYGSTSATISAQIDPELLDTTYTFQYGTDPTFADAGDLPVSPADIGAGYLPVILTASPSGLLQSTTYYYRVLAHNSFGGGSGATTVGPTKTFTTLAPPPLARTEGASEVTFDSAMVHGTVVPGSAGAASDTSWCFEYGSAGSNEYNLGSQPLLPGDAGQGDSGVPVSFRLTKLLPGSTYRYRLVAVNSLDLGLSSTACGTEGGHEADGAEGLFTTQVSLPAPVAITGASSEVSQNAATIAGVVEPRGARTSYEFQLGVDTSYGAQVFGEAGSDSEPRSVGLSLEHLQPGTTYHYRLVAISSNGTSFGADATFTTSVFTSAALSAPATEPLLATPSFAFPAVSSTIAGQSKAPHDKGKKKSRDKARKQSKRAGKTGGARDRRKGKGRGK